MLQASHYSGASSQPFAVVDNIVTKLKNTQTINAERDPERAKQMMEEHNRKLQRPTQLTQ